MNIKQKIIYYYFLILPFIDLVTSLLTRFTNIPISIGMIIKGSIMAFSVIYILFFSKSKYSKISKLYIFVLIFFFIFYILFKPDIWKVNYIFNEIVYAFRYLYFPVMLLGSFCIFDDFKINGELIKKAMFINCITYTVLLLLPFFTGTSFNSYNYSLVDGVTGWFYAANEVGAIVILLLYNIINFMDNSTKWKVILTLPILFSVSIIGTKVSLLGLILVTSIVLLTFLCKNKFKGILLSIVVILFLGYACYNSPAFKNIKSSINNYELSNDPKCEDCCIVNIDEINDDIYENENVQKFCNIYDEQNIVIKNKILDKFLTVSLNGRANLFLNNYVFYKKGGVSNILFGLSFSNRDSIGYNIDNKLIEIDYLDIFIHYGIIGFLIYFLPLILVFYNFIKNYKKIDLDGKLYLTMLLIGIAISCFAGHIFSAPAVSMYLILFIILIKNGIEDSTKLNLDEITIMSLHLNYGGIEKYISSLCNMLDKKFKINIITTYKINEKPSFEFSDNVNITYLINSGPNREDLKKVLKDKNIFKIIKEGLKSIKILYLKNYKNIEAIKNIKSKYIITTREFHNSLVGKYANRNIITIATEHNYHNNDKKYIKKVISSLKGIDYLVTVSEELKEFYEDKLNGTKCIYIPNVLDSLPNKETDLKENIIINVGRLEPEKGQKDLIDIAKNVKKEIKDLKLYIIGDGSLKSELELEIKKQNLEDTIILTGFLDKKEMEKYIIKSKLFVMTSYTESFGLVLLESMSYKVPCIAFKDANGAKNLLKNDIGILINNRDKNAMSKAIIEIMKNSKKLKEYSIKSYEESKKYLADNVKKQWLELLK